MELTSAFTSLNGVCSGAHGRQASRSLVSCGGRREDDGKGGAEQLASLLNCLNVIGMKLNDFFCRMGNVCSYLAVRALEAVRSYKETKTSLR